METPEQSGDAVRPLIPNSTLRTLAGTDASWLSRRLCGTCQASLDQRAAIVRVLADLGPVMEERLSDAVVVITCVFCGQRDGSLQE